MSELIKFTNHCSIPFKALCVMSICTFCLHIMFHDIRVCKVSLDSKKYATFPRQMAL